MIKRMPVRVLATLLAVVATFGVVSPALAHHPEIVASIVCTSGVPTINYTASAWVTSDPAARINPHIDVLVEGVKVGQGAFTEANNFSFSGSAPLPAGAAVGDTLSVTAIAVAEWGNGGEAGGTATTSVVVPYLTCGTTEGGTGRFTGGGSQVVVGGVKITRGLTIHCDLLLSNNLEVNWQGNRFHTTEHLTTVACTDDPAIVQAPPPAPLDTLIGVGAGRYNGSDGYTIEFTLVDYGEPGRDDRAAIRIFQTSNPGNVVLNVPLQTLTSGNLQAHYDQPHK